MTTLNQKYIIADNAKWLKNIYAVTVAPIDMGFFAEIPTSNILSMTEEENGWISLETLTPIDLTTRVANYVANDYNVLGSGVNVNRTVVGEVPEEIGNGETSKPFTFRGLVNIRNDVTIFFKLYPSKEVPLVTGVSLYREVEPRTAFTYVIGLSADGLFMGSTSGKDLISRLRNASNVEDNSTLTGWTISNAVIDALLSADKFKLYYWAIVATQVCKINGGELPTAIFETIIHDADYVVSQLPEDTQYLIQQIMANY